MPIMIWFAIAIEGAIQNWPDFGILCALQAINGFIGLCVPHLWKLVASSLSAPGQLRN